MNHLITCPNCYRETPKPGFCHHCKRREGVCFAWFVIALAALILVSVSSCKGASVVTADFVSWVEQRESGGNAKARGKAGELGCMQLKAIAVREVNRIHGTRYQHQDALDPIKARWIGAAYLRICETRCAIKTRDAVYRRYRGLK